MSNDVKRAIQKLEGLRQEISTLEGLPPMSQQFADWHGKLACVIGETFGDDSKEMQEFGRIGPELPKEATDEWEERITETPGELFKEKGLSEAEAKRLKNAVGCLMAGANSVYFRKRLAEYQELIVTLIYSLRSR